MPPVELLGGTTPVNLVTWLAAQCYTGKSTGTPPGALGPMGEVTLNEMCELVREKTGAPASVQLAPGFGEITLAELQAIVEDTRTLDEILAG